MSPHSDLVPTVLSTVGVFLLINSQFLKILCVFRILLRESFKQVTRCEVEKGERRIQHPEEKLADTAKLGLGVMLLMGGLYIGKKIFRK